MLCRRRDPCPMATTADFTPAVPWTMLAGRRGRPRPMSDAADEIAGKVTEIVVGHLGVAEASVVSNASFIDDLGADSLDTVDLIMAFEDTFRIGRRSRSRCRGSSPPEADGHRRCTACKSGAAG